MTNSSGSSHSPTPRRWRFFGPSTPPLQRVARGVKLDGERIASQPVIATCTAVPRRSFERQTLQRHDSAHRRMTTPPPHQQQGWWARSRAMESSLPPRAAYPHECGELQRIA